MYNKSSSDIQLIGWWTKIECQSAALICSVILFRYKCCIITDIDVVADSTVRLDESELSDTTAKTNALTNDNDDDAYSTIGTNETALSKNTTNNDNENIETNISGETVK